MRVGGQEFWWVGLTGACGIEVSVNVVGTGFSVHMCGHSRMDFHCVLALALACSAHTMIGAGSLVIYHNPYYIWS